ncbi:hypothetical protein PX554_19830 [Sphingomonas sp. H39-1-10]|uniref:hypothetical protein n=1 Tax=Sphingomonas pollutisoli TaxID=3030829 RepID=UPI0023B937F5|nr:hypothetical protein [Sphingomonas pollutisoli]MDF0490382.1 hypothetical protein [Sphingomonas pollutisoli]
MALQLQGAEIDEAEVFSHAADVTLPNRSRRETLTDPFDGLGTWQASLSAAGRHWREDLPFSAELPESWSEAPTLVRALEIVRQFARADRGAAPWLHLPILLHRMEITASPLPCLVAGAKAFRFPRHDAAATLTALLRQLARIAAQGRERLDAIEADRKRAIQTIAAQRRPGMMTPLLALLQHRPVLSPEKAAQALKITVSGAGKLLAKAASAGLVREISGRGSWRVYVMPDLAVHFGFAAAPAGRPRSVPEPAPELEAVIADFDREMAAIDAMLNRRPG